MKRITQIISILAALFVSLPIARAAEFTWSPYFPYVYSFDDQGWIWYSTLGTDGIYAITLDGPNKDAFVELVAPTPSNAPDSIGGKKVTLITDSGDIAMQFHTNGKYTETAMEDGEPYTSTGSYTYYKTGPGSGVIIADFDDENALFTVVLSFTSASAGTLEFKFVSATLGDYDSGTASFTVE